MNAIPILDTAVVSEEIRFNMSAFVVAVWLVRLVLSGFAKALRVRIFLEAASANFCSRILWQHTGTEGMKSELVSLG
jgi:hypothetical protein